MSFRSKKNSTVIKSVVLKSIRNLQGDSAATLTNEVPEFERTIEAACLAFECPQKIVLWRDPTGSPFQPADTKSKRHLSKMSQHTTPERKKGNVTEKSQETVVTASTVRIKETAPKSDKDKVVLRSNYDSHNRLTELHLVRVPHVPRILMQVLTFYTPLYKYLNKIVIKKCGIDFSTIRELNKILGRSSITDVCLDDSILTECNYAVLLDAPTKLKNLSLSRCNINDEICKQIATRLDQFATPTDKTLQLLNLTSNQITDEGAKQLGIALRSNRTLRYLNLSGNMITDEGAGYIFDALMVFPLTYQENINRRHRNVLYLKERLKQHEKDKCEMTNVINQKQASSFRTMSVSSDSIMTKDIKSRTELLVNDIMRDSPNPYNTNNVEIRDGITHCIGNTSLCYLNLAYNNLAFPSLSKLLNVLKYQNDITLIPDAGLMKVVLEGNFLPRHCEELIQINDYFAKKYCKRDTRKSKSVSSGRNRGTSRIKFD